MLSVNVNRTSLTNLSPRNLKFEKPPSRISKEMLTFITTQTEPASRITSTWLYGFAGGYPNVALTYAAPWPRTRVNLEGFLRRSQFLLVQYHIRFLKASYAPIDLSRSGRLAPENEGELELLRSVWQEDTSFLTSEEKPLFTIVTLQDTGQDYSWDTRLSQRLESDIQGSGMAAGISAFQYIVSMVLKRWNENWNHTLDYIDKIRTVEVRMFRLGNRNFS
jgi:hypothetical protein